MDYKSKKFLLWLANRLIFKHGYSKGDPIVERLLSLGNKKFVIDDSDLDDIISKYYTGFFLDKTEDCNIGYSEQERNDIRSHVKSLLDDIVNKNIPSQVLK